MLSQQEPRHLSASDRLYNVTLRYTGGQEMTRPHIYADNAEKQRAYRVRHEEERRAEQTAKGVPPAPVLPAMSGTLRWRALVERAHLTLECAHDEMADYVDERKDTWQESARG